MAEKEKHIIVIGGDAAGMSAASKAKRVDPDLRVTVYEKGEFISYAACGIPYLIAGDVKSLDDLVILDPEKAKSRRGLDVRIFHEVVSIQPKKHTVSVKDLKTGKTFTDNYDKLIIATGSVSREIPVNGLDLPGVFFIKNLEDARRIQNFMRERTPKSAVVIGGGYIGLEMVESLSKRGLKVTLVEQMDRVMTSIDTDLAEIVEEEMRQNGVDVLLRTSLAGIQTSGDQLEVFLAGGPGKVTADMVLLTIGLLPAGELAKAAGARLGYSGAIRVNDKMETTIPDIYAAGDCVEYMHLVTHRNTYIPLAPAANKSGRTAGANAAGMEIHFPGVIGTSITRIFDLEIARTGLSDRDISDTSFVKTRVVTVKVPIRAEYMPETKDMTIRVISDGRSGKILGAQVLGYQGSCKRIDLFAMAIHNEMTLEDFKMMDFGYSPLFSPAYDPVLVTANAAKKFKSNNYD